MIRRSRPKTVLQQERRVATDLAGKTQPGSGNKWYAKGDVATRKYLIECKQTGGKSYGLTLAVLDKIQGEAAKAGKEAVLQVDFLKPTSIESFAVIPYHLFLQFVEES